MKLDDVKAAKNINIETIGIKTNITVDGEPIDLKGVLSMDIHIEPGITTFKANKEILIDIGDY